MHDPEIVRSGERPKDLEPDVADTLGRQGAVGELVAQRATGQPLHHDERPAVLLTGVQDAHHMGMAQAGCETSLRHDALTHAVLLGEIRSEQLEGDLPVES